MSSGFAYFGDFVLLVSAVSRVVSLVSVVMCPFPWFHFAVSGQIVHAGPKYCSAPSSFVGFVCLFRCAKNVRKLYNI